MTFKCKLEKWNDGKFQQSPGLDIRKPEYLTPYCLSFISCHKKRSRKAKEHLQMFIYSLHLLIYAKIFSHQFQNYPGIISIKRYFKIDYKPGSVEKLFKMDETCLLCPWGKRKYGLGCWKDPRLLLDSISILASFNMSGHCSQSDFHHRPRCLCEGSETLTSAFPKTSIVL